METHSNILARRILWSEDPDRLHSWGQKESDTEHVHTHVYFSLWTPVHLFSFISNAVLPK